MDRKTTHPRLVNLIAFAAIVVMAFASAAPVHAQRFEILVTRYEALNGTRGNFGRDIMRELNKRIENLQTHMPADEKRVRDELKAVNMKEEELDACHEALQFASRIDVKVAMCGSFESVDGGYRVSSTVVDVQTRDQFEMEPFVSDDAKEAADRILSWFQQNADALNNVTFCAGYVQSQQWQEALNTCDKALATLPEHKAALYYRGRSLLELDRKEEALAGFEKVIALDAAHEDALYSAGIVAFELGQTEKSREYFRQYLALNPGNADVRLTLAQDLVKVGDHEGALGIVEAGMTPGSQPDPKLVAYAGSLALNAAATKMEAGDTAGARPLFEKAIKYLEPQYDEEGARTDSLIVRNLVAAYSQLGDLERTAAFAEKATSTHPGDAQVWMLYAQTLQKLERLDDALTALDKALVANPEARVFRMKTVWLLQAKRVEAAAEAGRKAIETGEWENADELARNIAATGHNEFAQKRQYQEAFRIYDIARQFAQHDSVKAFINFYHGYGLVVAYKAPLDKTDPPPTCQDARGALPHMQKALQLIENSAAFTEQASVRAALKEQIETYIVIAEGTIRAFCRGS